MERMNEMSEIIGYVRQSDINTNFIAFKINEENDERVKKGRNLVVECKLEDGGRKIYYCIVENITQPSSKTIDLLSDLSNLSDSDYVDFNNSGLNENKGFQLIGILQCFKTIYYNSNDEIIYKENFIKPPLTLSIVREPTIKEYFEIVSDENWKNYWTGSLVSKSNIFVPINFQRLIELSSGVFGKSGSGKSVTTRNILNTLIYDPDRVLKTTAIIFDVMNEYAINTHSNKIGDKGLAEYPMLKDKIEILSLDNKHAESAKICRINNGVIESNYNYKEFFIYKDTLKADHVIKLLSQSDSFSDKMYSTILSMEDEAYKRKQNNKDNDNFYAVMKEFYDDDYIQGTEDEIGSLGYRLTRTESSYYAIKWRIKPFLYGIYTQTRILRDRVEGTQDTLEYLLKYLDLSNHDFDIEYPDGIIEKENKSFIIYFGSYGINDQIYNFITNIIITTFYHKYTGNDNYKIVVNGVEQLKYKRCVLVVEECHKIIEKGKPNPIFENMAKELRKLNLTLMLIDQMPSSINEKVMANLENRIIHQMRNMDDVNMVLSGLSSDFKSHVQKLNVGEGLYLGNMIDMPMIIKSYFPTNFEEACNLRYGKISERNYNTIPKKENKLAEKVKKNRGIQPNLDSEVLD